MSAYSSAPTVDQIGFIGKTSGSLLEFEGATVTPGFLLRPD